MKLIWYSNMFEIFLLCHLQMSPSFNGMFFFLYKHLLLLDFLASNLCGRVNNGRARMVRFLEQYNSIRISLICHFPTVQLTVKLKSIKNVYRLSCETAISTSPGVFITPRRGAWKKLYFIAFKSVRSILKKIIPYFLKAKILFCYLQDVIPWLNVVIPSRPRLVSHLRRD